jgi:Tol biopolymer transport system component
MNADGSDRRKLSEGRGWDGLARYSPDGSRIVFTGGRTGQAGSDYYEIFVMKSNGTDIVQITDTTAWEQSASAGPAQGHSDEVKVPWNSVPAWSPDGSMILFATNRSSEGTVPVLYSMNPDGSDQRPFGFPFSIEGTEPDWSPVTNQIVFSRGSAAKGEIWVMDGGSPFPTFTARKILANIDNNHSPSWSPDGKQIVFVSDKYGTDKIFIMNADGSDIKRVTYEKSNDRYPTWR